MAGRLILRNCRLVNVYSGRIEDTDVTIAGDRVASIDAAAAGPDDRVIDCAGRFVAPGLIDAHMHVDTTFLWPGELARAIVPLGTTTLFVDPTNNAHTGGKVAVDALARLFDGLPLRGIVGAPSYAPFDATLGTAAVEMGPEDIAALLVEGADSIGETVWTRLEQDDRAYQRIVQTCRQAGLRVSGHGGEVPRGADAAFDGYVAAGIQDDHCIGRPDDIAPRLRRGLMNFLVECTGRRGQLPPLLDRYVARGLPTRRAALTTDNNTAMDIVTNGFGFMDYLVRLALHAGIPPVEAWRMASLNPAEHHRRSADLGGIAPGRLADMLVMDAPDAFPPRMVIVGGRVVAEEGRLCVPIPAPRVLPAYRRSIDLSRVPQDALDMRAGRDRGLALARVIRCHDGDAFNTEVRATLPVVDGLLHPDPARDILKIAVIERYGRKGTVGLGLATGFGLRRGAMATSISVPFNNIVAVGADDAAIWTAVRRIEALQGGFVVADGDAILAEVPLPVGGLMTTQPYETFLAEVAAAEDAARGLGCPLVNPFKTLVSTCHTTLPDLGLTDLGLLDTRTGRRTDLVVAWQDGEPATPGDRTDPPESWATDVAAGP